MSIQFWKIPANGGVPEGFTETWKGYQGSEGEREICVSDKDCYWAIRNAPLPAADKWLVRTGENDYTIADDTELKRLCLKDHFSTFPDEAKRKKLIEGCMEVSYFNDTKNNANVFVDLNWEEMVLPGFSMPALFALRDKNWPEALRYIPASFWGEGESTGQPAPPEQPKDPLKMYLVKNYAALEVSVIAADPTEAQIKSGLRSARYTTVITVISENPVL